MLELVETVLSDIGAGNNRRIYIFNKTDLVDDRETLSRFRRNYPQSAAVSALTGGGLEPLKWLISDILRSGETEATRQFQPERFDLVAWLYRRGAVMEKKMNGERMELRLRLPEGDLRKLDSAIANGKFPS